MATAFQRIGLVVLVVLATSGVWQAAAQVEAKKERPQWEYTWAGEGASARAMGDEGWELVAVSSRGGSDTLYFKRQK
jgi:hypothetical protein